MTANLEIMYFTITSFIGLCVMSIAHIRILLIYFARLEIRCLTI